MLNIILSLILAKRLSESQKKEIKDNFINGITVDELSKKFSCTKLTIIRNLKKILDEKEYDFLINNNKILKINQSISQESEFKEVDNKLFKNHFNDFNSDTDNPTEKNKNTEFFTDSEFMEIAPLDLEINNDKQRDLSSVSISEIDLPKTVYMIVDNRIELEIKLLQDYPEWEFLSLNELKRKTIEIYFDLKIAKRFCDKNQKVIKVPNTHVFKLTAPILLSRGISRIVSPDNLIAL